MSTAIPVPERAPLHSAPDVHGRLAQQRPRPILVRLYAALLAETGLLGPPVRRRLRRFLLRSLPPAAAVGAGALVVLGAFDGLTLGWGQAAALLALAGAVSGVAIRRALRARDGLPASWREQLELGTLLLVAAHALARTAGGGEAESPLHPLVYLVVAFLVPFLARGVGFALVGLAVALELLAWVARGAAPWALAPAAAHAAFVTLFAVLYHAVLAARMASASRAEAAAVERRLRDIADRAAELRLLTGGDGGDPAEREKRWTEGAVVEVEAAVLGALELAEISLRTHTVAVLLLSPDDRELRLRECRSASEAVTRDPIPAGEGPLGGALRRRAPVRLHGEVRGAAYYRDGTCPRALLAVPLIEAEARGGHVRGLVVADRLVKEPFDARDERLLVTLAAEVVRALAAERLMIDMKRARDEKERFYEAIERLNRTTKPPEVCDATLEVAKGMVPVDFAAVALLEEAEGRSVFRVVRARGDGKASALEGLEFEDRAGHGLVAAAVRLGSSLPGKDLDLAKTQVFDAPTRLKGLASLKVIPLRTAQKVLGALVLGAQRSGAYPPDAVRQLDVVAMQAAESIYRARLFEQTERLATTDGLTGLTNHRTFQGRLDEHLAQAQRYGKKLSLLLCDIDHFKSVNDTHGHPMGDLVLRGVAKTLQKEARATDVVARYGGEEFAVVMPETDAAGALVIAERIRERVKALAFDTAQGKLKVTISLGVAAFPDDGGEKAALVERADGALYHAKRHGRDRAVLAGSLRGPAPARLERA